jgi:dinuclear metal center YbgI/SA1388 family protein
MKIKDIVAHLETIAPPSYQESYDNSGLLVGHGNTAVSGILITLDITEDIIDEAISLGYNMIIAHHPLIFSGIKRLNGNHWVEKCVIKAIKNDIAIYAIHTNLDNVIIGVNAIFAQKLGLVNTKILSPKNDTLSKLVTYVPKSYYDQVTNALFDAGAGKIGNYDRCSFTQSGIGTYRPGQESNAFHGEIGKNESVDEKRIEVLIPKFNSKSILKALKNAHPYEEVAYYLTPLSNENQEIGSGMIGELPESMNTDAFLEMLKEKMNAKGIRYTSIIKSEVKKIALCGGSGSFLLKQAKNLGADVFVSADFKYHEFFEAEGKLVIADIGHYESEQFTKDLLFDILSKKFTNIALRLSKLETNPIKYL